MPSSQKTFRVFVSSTFSDMRAERRILQEKVFPDLKKLCETKGASFQAVDLRWGVNEEAQLDHKTIDICLNEIARCQKLSPKPNFIILMGDRYGWQPIPSKIPSSKMVQIHAQLSQEDRKDIDKWYWEDLNAIPAEYVLQPRGETYREYNAWAVIEARLRKILRDAVDRLNFTEEQRVKYFASATHQEIIRGALNPPAETEHPEEHVFAYLRNIRNLPETPEAKDYIDLADNVRDPYCKTQIETLKRVLKDESLPKEHVYEYEAEWKNGCEINNLEAFGARVYADLSRIIEQQLAEIEEVDEITKEVQLHEKFKNDRLEHFVGQDEAITAIKHYLGSKSNKVLSLIGASGSGKTSIMAKAIEDALTRKQPGGVIVYRFAGTTSGTSEAYKLLYQMIQQITTAYNVEMNSLLKEGEDEKKFSTVYGLRDILARSFALASAEKPLTIFIDALDQLASDYASLSLDWIPQALPEEVKEQVKFVVSALPELKGKLSQTEIHEVIPMSEKDGRQVLERWLGAIKRTLKKEQKDEVISKFTANGTPLYLKLAFEKAKTWQSYTTDIEIKPDIEGMLGEYFNALQSSHGALFVKKFCGYVLSGKYQGLMESELLDLFVFDKEHWDHFVQSSHEDHRDEIKELGRLPIVVWSRFSLDLEPYLTEKDATGFSIISFYHRKFAEYAKKRYAEDSASYHKILADYFETRWREPYNRAIDELAHQRTKARDFEGIERVLTDLEFIEAKFTAGMAAGLIADYNAIGAGRAKPGPPIVTAKLHGGRYGIFCPFCLAKSEVKQSRLNSTVNCSACGNGLKVNPFSVEAEWHPVGPTKDLMKGKASLKFEISKTLNEFSDFVHENAHILKVRPGYTFQQAFYRPDNTSPYKKAAKHARPLLNWVNKPQSVTACIQTFKGHTGRVTSCAYSPDGRHIVSSSDVNSPDGRRNVLSSDENPLKVWETETGLELISLKGHMRKVNFCAYSPDGRRIVSASDDNTLKVWDPETGQELFTLKGHKYAVRSCAYSPDGRHIVSASNDNTLKVWDAEIGQELLILKGHTNYTTSCAYSPDGGRIVSASKDDTLKVWDAKTGQELFIFKGQIFKVTSCAYSPDGRYIVSSSDDNILKVWDAETGHELSSLKGHTRKVNSCTYSPDGRLIISASEDESLKVWDAETGQEQFTLKGHSEGVRFCAFSPDGKRIVSSSDDNTLKVWDAETSHELSPLEGHTRKVNSCTYSPDARLIVSASEDETLKVWDAETSQRRFTLKGHSEGVQFCAFSPDGMRIVSTSGEDFSDDKTVKVWSAETGRELFTRIVHADNVRTCAYSPDGRRIVWISKDDSLKICDADTGHELLILKGHTDWVGTCAYSPDGRRIVSASKDKTLKIWDAEIGHELITLKGHIDWVRTCEYSPDGRRIVSTSEDRTLKVWDAETGQERFTLEGYTGLFSYSPDGRRIVSASKDDSLKVWAAETGQELLTLKGQKEEVQFCAYSPDGMRIVSASLKSVKVWDTMTGSELLCFYVAYVIRAVSCTSGGVAVGDNNGTVYILKRSNWEENEPYVTLLRLYRFDRKAWDDQLTAKCEWCGKRFEPAIKIVDAIKSLNAHLSPNQSHAESLPPEAWDDPRLFSECPNCHKSLRFNPFIVDNSTRVFRRQNVERDPEIKPEEKQHKPWWKFW